MTASWSATRLVMITFQTGVATQTASVPKLAGPVRITLPTLSIPHVLKIVETQDLWGMKIVMTGVIILTGVNLDAKPGVMRLGFVREVIRLILQFVLPNVMMGSWWGMRLVMTVSLMK